ncbi:MAG: hypothetical protein RL708_2132 [Bacteroidota bacterium]|jgi:hypothetical protein
MKKNILWFVALLFVFGCKKKQTVYDTKTEYFPLAVGSWIIYDVDSLVYNSFTLTSYTHHFQLKELIASSFIDASNEKAFVLERYERDSITQDFKLKNKWVEKNANNKAEKIEENQRFIKMTFPPIKNNTWKGNAYLQIDPNDENSKFLTDWDYKYSIVDEKISLGNHSFDSSITVLQHDDYIVRLQKSYFKEVYAKHVGLVYYQHTFLEQQPSDPTWKSGFDVKATINSNGKN